MSLKVWLLALTLFLIMVISSTVSGANQPGIGDAAYELGTFYLKQETPVTGIVPFGLIKAAYKNPNPRFSRWYDPFYDDLGWGLAKDSAAFGSALPGAKIPFTFVGGYLTLLQYQNDAIIKWENEHGVTDFWLSVLPHEPLDSSSGSLSSSSKLAQRGLGAPQLSPPTSDMLSGDSTEGPGVSGTSGVSGTGKGKIEVLYLEMSFEEFGKLNWLDMRNRYSIPPVPRYLASGELNTYGYDFIYQPGSEAYRSEYHDWVKAYVASFESTVAGVGTLGDEGLNGGEEW